MAGHANPDSNHPRGSERLWRRLRSGGASFLRNGRTGLTWVSKNHQRMNPKSQIVATAASPLIAGQVRAQEWPPALRDFYTSLFSLLEQMELRYCVLHSPEPQTVDSPSAIELTVHPEDRKRLASLIDGLSHEGFLHLQRIPVAAGDFRYDFATATDSSARFFSVIVREIFPAGNLIVWNDELFSRRINRNGVWTLSEADEFCYLLSRISLEGAIGPSQETRVNELVRILGLSTVGKIATRLLGDDSQHAIMTACADGQWNLALQPHRSDLLRLKFWRAPIDCIKYRLSQIRSTLRRWLYPCGVLIVILGPDGAGKSTTTQKTAEFFGPLFSGYRNIMWRPQVLMPSPKIDVPSFDPPHTKPAHGALRSVVKLFAVAADYCAAYPTLMWSLLSRRTLITIDRDVHDILVDQVRYRYGGPKWLMKIAVGLAPLPKAMYLILDAEDNIILNRKNEVTPEELSRQRKAYADLAAKLPNSSVIRTDISVDATISQIAKSLFTFMANRNAHRHSSKPAGTAALPSEKQPAAPQSDHTNMPELPETRSKARILMNMWNTVKSWVLKCSTAIMDHGLISLSNFLLGIVLARYLGSEQYGAYALAFSTFVLLSLVHSALAMEPMSVFAPSIYRKSLREYLGLLLWIQIAGSAIIVACTIAGGTLFRLLGQHSNLISAMEGIALASPCVLIFLFARRAFYLELRPAQALIGSIVYCTLLSFGLWAVAAGHLLSPFATFLVMGTGALLTSVLLLTLLRPTVSRKAIAKVLSVKEVCVRHWEYGRWAFASALFVWVPWNGFYSVVAHFSGLAESGALKALLNLAMPMTQTFAAFSLLFISQAARLGHEKGWEEVKKLAWRIAGLYTLGSSAYWLLICLFRTELIRLMYAGHYSEIAPLVPVVAAASILSGAAMGPTIAIRAMRSPASVTAIYFGSSLVCALVGIPACRAWGIRGAVVGILLSSAISAGTGFLMVRSRKLHARMSAPGAERLAPESVSVSS
jgi:O-antigen/teichoic acid export membrane protein/thymidylate kinase